MDIKPEVYFKLKAHLTNLGGKINKLNQEHERKRMINISFIIKKILKKYDKQEAKKIKLNIGEDTKHMMFGSKIFNPLLNFITHHCYKI